MTKTKSVQEVQREEPVQEVQREEPVHTNDYDKTAHEKACDKLTDNERVQARILADVLKPEGHLRAAVYSDDSKADVLAALSEATTYVKSLKPEEAPGLESVETPEAIET